LRQLLSAQRLRVFASLASWRDEFRLYRRDDKGIVVKAKDHLMDATRYLVMSGRDRMRCAPAPETPSIYRRLRSALPVARCPHFRTPQYTSVSHCTHTLLSAHLDEDVFGDGDVFHRYAMRCDCYVTL
jgi:hypothetical protein